MSAAPALQGCFTEMRMKDVQVPAQYEALVFIGFDQASPTVIAMSYQTDSGSWTFVRESAQPEGSWKHVARYEVKRI